MAVPTIRGVGTVASGIGTIAPAYPTGTAAGDLVLMFIETTGGESPTCTGWSHTPSSPQATGLTTNGTKLSILYRTVSNPATDNRTTNDPGNHILARIIGITTGTFYTVDPFNTSAGGVDAIGGATNPQQISSITTTVADCLIFAAITGSLPDATGTTEFSNWTNANLASLTERIDNSTNSGNGGSLGVASGEKATAGSVGATEVDAVTTLSNFRANIQIAIAPVPPTLPRRVFNIS